MMKSLLSVNNFIGIIGVAILMQPMTSKACQTIPITFNNGDTISATVINQMFSQLNNVIYGFSTSSDIDGLWNCTTSTRMNNDDPDCTADGLLFSKTGTMLFNAAAGTWDYTNSSGNNIGAANSCGSFNSNGFYEVRSNRLVLSGTHINSPNDPGAAAVTTVYPMFSVCPDVFQLTGDNDSIVECSRVATPPATANNLVAIADQSPPHDVTLTWSDQSTDETGFIVERSMLPSMIVTVATTTLENVTNYTDSGLTSGTYFYRIVATNANGDAIGSSIVSVIIP